MVGDPILTTVPEIQLSRARQHTPGTAARLRSVAVVVDEPHGWFCLAYGDAAFSAHHGATGHLKDLVIQVDEHTMALTWSVT